MGLYITSVSELPLSEKRFYYLYVLDYYNWNEPVSDVLRSNSERIASACAENDAVMIKGLPDCHFSSEVLSWLKINGEGPKTVLPALLITSIHPKYFIDSDHSEQQDMISNSLIFIKIRDVCKNPGDVVVLLEKVHQDIKDKKKIKDFTIAREERKGEHGALVDALILEQNIAGVGVNIKSLISWADAKRKKLMTKGYFEQLSLRGSV